jgi:hypothetical protein
MQDMRSIEVDFDVNKRIETERVSFAETANDVLRRLLGIEMEVTDQKRGPVAFPAGASWHGKGVTLPDTTQLKMTYNGKTYEGVISDGVWLIAGKKYTSPSAAAGAVGMTKDGRKTSLDGWLYWQAKLPNSSRWAKIRNLREKGSR